MAVKLRNSVFGIRAQTKNYPRQKLPRSWSGESEQFPSTVKVKLKESESEREMKKLKLKLKGVDKESKVKVKDRIEKVKD
jgi:hypothetical protein